jgi:hypothetical protein
MTAPVDTIMAKFTRRLAPPYRHAAADLAGMSYDELLPLVRAGASRLRTPADVMASYRAAAIIGAALGATRMEHGTDAYALRMLRGLPGGRGCSRDTSKGHTPAGPLFDHSVTFFDGRKVLAILARPYPNTDVAPQAAGLSGDLAVWVQPSEMCSYYPGGTVSYLLTRRDHPCPGLGFEALSAANIRSL